jgi:hypothetical protein
MPIILPLDSSVGAKTAFFERLNELNEGRRQSGMQPGSSVQFLGSTKCLGSHSDFPSARPDG